MHKYIRSILEYDRDMIPPMYLGFLTYFIGGCMIIIVTALIVANVSSLRPGFLWTPDMDRQIPSYLSFMITIYPVTILMYGMFNPTAYSCKRFKYHWCGMETTVKANWFNKYMDTSIEYNGEKINALWNYMQGYFSDRLNVKILAQNQFRYKMLCKVLHYSSLSSIVIGFLYIGYISGIQWCRGYTSMEIMDSMLLMKSLTTFPLMGIFIHYFTLMFFNPERWRRVKDYKQTDAENALAYYHKNEERFDSLDIREKLCI